MYIENPRSSGEGYVDMYGCLRCTFIIHLYHFFTPRGLLFFHSQVQARFRNWEGIEFSVKLKIPLGMICDEKCEDLSSLRKIKKLVIGFLNPSPDKNTPSPSCPSKRVEPESLFSLRNSFSIGSKKICSKPNGSIINLQKTKKRGSQSFGKSNLLTWKQIPKATAATTTRITTSPNFT